MRIHFFAAAAAAATLLVGPPARANEATAVPCASTTQATICAGAPRDPFRPEAHLRSVVENFLRYRVARIGIDGGCYAVLAIDRNGTPLEVRFRGSDLNPGGRHVEKEHAAAGRAVVQSSERGAHAAEVSCDGDTPRRAERAPLAEVPADYLQSLEAAARQRIPRSARSPRRGQGWFTPATAPTGVARPATRKSARPGPPCDHRSFDRTARTGRQSGTTDRRREDREVVQAQLQ